MKKRLLSAILSFCMLLTMAPTVAFAADGDDEAANTISLADATETSGTCGAEGNNVTWKLTQNNEGNENPTYTLTISGSGAMADYYAQYVQRKDEFTGDIAPWRRALLSDPSVERTTEEVVPITKVEIGDGVTRIGSGAFAYTELTGTVTFSENVTSYGDGVFARDTSITAVDWTNFKPTEKITDGWATVYTEKHIAIPYAFFDGCSSLDTSIIGSTEYSGQLVLPNTIEAIYVAAFRNTGFSTVDFSNGLSSIKAVGSYAITNLANMTEFTYPGNVDFYGTNDEGQNNVIQGGGIEKLTIAKEVTELPANFCTDTEKLTAIEFESGSQLTKIGEMAFYGNQALKSIDIPSTVTAIGESAFADCFSLEKIELGHIESFGQNTFARCSSLKTAKIQGSSDVAYPSNMFGTWGTGHSAAPLETLEIDAGKIQFSLSNNQKDSIETIVLGDGVTEIPNNFAANCTKLTSVSLPDALTSVPANAFQGCSSLEKVGISENSKLQSIGSGAFVNSGLTQIYIPKNVTSIGNGAFNRTPITVFDMSDVLAESMEVGNYAINNWYASDEKKPDWKDNFKYIYVSNSGVANSVKAKTSNCNYAFFVTNGGSVDATKTGFAAVSCAGYTAKWYDNENCTGSPVTGNPETGKTYYAKWTKSANVALTSNPAADADGKVSATYTPSGAVTLSVQTPGADWLYVWMKDGKPINGTESSLTLCAPSDSGKYTVKVMAGGSSTDVWMSNAINVTITKADGSASVSLPGWIYGETASKPVPTSKTNGINNVTYQYKVKGAGDTTYSDTLPINAGDYTVKATFAATDNYNEVTATADFTIAKATPAVVISASPSTLTGGGSVELTVSGVPTEGQLAVTCDNDIKVTEKDGKYTAALPNETKDYTFKADYTGTDLYNNASDTCVVSVTYKGSSHHSSSTSNTVSASTASNGKVSLDKSTVKKGDTVTVTVTPDAGYQLDKLTVTDAKGNTIAVAKKGDNQYTFTMPDSKVTITPTFSKIADTKPSKNGFDDVASSDWFADAVKYVSDKGLMNGTDDNQFSPNASTTRGMLITVLARYAGEDTTGGATWYEKSMEWAKAKGVSDGTNPNANITREQLVTMMYRYAGSPKADGKLDSFSDAASVSTYAADAMQWAVANGIVNGSNGKLNPQDNATRAEVAAILMRFCEMSK